MKIKCKCGKVIVEGNILERKNKRRFDINYKPLGTILKNKSNNPNNWKGICSDCQKNKQEDASKCATDVVNETLNKKVEE